MSYYCPNCKRNHRPSTNIYKKHLHLKKVEEDEIPSKKLISCVFSDLPKIAKRQIDHYLQKMVWDKRKNFSKKRQMYIREINRVILEENDPSFLLR